MMGYAELHSLSNFTFLRGASHPEELVRQALDLGYRALALTDECSIAGIVRAHLAARECGLPLIIGSEFTLADGPRLVLLATSHSGYRCLVQLITRARCSAPKGQYRLTIDDVSGQSLNDCLGLLLCDPGPVPTAELSRHNEALELDTGWLGEILPNRAWISVEQPSNGCDRQHLDCLRSVSNRTGIPLIATGNVHMHTRERQCLQDTLSAIRQGITVTHGKGYFHSNAERHLRSLPLLRRTYPAELLDETVAIADQCRFSLDSLQYQYPAESSPDTPNPTAYLRQLTEEGMRRRWPEKIPKKVRKQVDHELALIEELGYEAYFLTVYDIVQFARSRNILCQGRGSAANSAVCFSLGITEVDPARLNILFERFISRESNEPPDIDVDFEHERREEVMQYI